MSSGVQSPLSSSQYQLAILQAIADTGITQFAAGGKARAFGDIVADQLGRMETREFINLSQTLLPYATGENLDFLGELYGIYRLSAQTAVSQSTDNNFRFYVEHGTFGDINNGKAIVVPDNVQITSSNGSPVFATDAITLQPGDSSQAVSATSITAGSAGNVSQSLMTSHNFTGYAQSSFGSLLVTNDFGIVGGSDAETDDNFRSRINLRLQSPSGANEAALRFAILQLPGIQNIVFDAYAGGFDCYVYSVVPQPAASLLQNVQKVIDATIAYPNEGLAVAPDLVGVSLSTVLTLQLNLSTTDQTNIVSTAIAAVQDYIDNLGIGAPLVINEIATVIFNSDSRVVDVGRPNNEIPEILIWRSRPDGTRYSRYLLGNYTPNAGERLVVETSANVPVPVNLTVVAA